MELITLEDYYLFKKLPIDSQQITKRIRQLAKSVQNKIAQAKDQEALDKMKQIGLELEAKRETEQEKVLVSP